MDFEPVSQSSNERFDESISLRETFEKYFRHYPWFVISIISFLILAFLFNRYSVPKYRIGATILIKENEKESSFDKLSSIEDIGLFGVGTNKLENEIQILKSRRLVSKVVEELNLDYQYYLKDSPYDKEIYPNYPITLNLVSDTTENGSILTEFEIKINSKETFDFTSFEGNVLEGINFGKGFNANLGNEDLNNFQNLALSLNENFHDEFIGQTFIVKIKPFYQVVDQYLEKLEIEPVNEKLSNVISIGLTESVRLKGIAIINNLIEQFNADGIEDKNMIAQSTTNFLDDRLVLISNELEAIEATAAQFKTSKGMINADVEASYFMQSSTATDSQVMEANTQLNLVKYMEGELNKSGPSDLLPGNIGLADPGIVNLISDYNELVLQRNRILKSSSTKNPIVQNIDSQLQVLRSNLQGSLNNLRSSSEIQLSALNKQSGSISSKIASAPKFEKEFKDIVREQETKNALYLFLLQKREESILSNAVKVDKAKIIDSAYGNLQPISPKKTLIYLASLVLGLIVPIAIIYVMKLLDTKVRNENDFSFIGIPYLGDIPFINRRKKLIDENDSSNIAESFRYLRTNLSFMLDDKGLGKTVYVTSTISGEGKSFTAINLARSLAMSGKKTVLLGMDLRSPKFFDYLNIEKSIGVSNFIKDDSIEPADIIRPIEALKTLSIVNSGDVPPNPVELLMSSRVTKLFEHLKENYEYIVVDTAPVGLVTDTIQIGKFADLTIYVVKYNFLDKRMLKVPKKLHEESKLKEMAFLINCSDHSNESYGYGYGYGYGKAKKEKWFKKIFKSAAF